MAWIVLVVSGVLETVWAAALAQSRGFTRLVPSVVFGVALVLSMAGLAYALRSIPVGTGYAVWVGIGAVGASVYGMVALGEPATAARLLCLVAIVGGVVGLPFLHRQTLARAASTAEPLPCSSGGPARGKWPPVAAAPGGVAPRWSLDGDAVPGAGSPRRAP
jgi:quaternary ammonium compound-resistance protein SugE